MSSYKHTQVGYLVIVVTSLILALFAWTYFTARAEAPTVDSGTNLLVTAIMVLILFLLVSFTTLTITIDEKYLHLKFGFGIFKKSFALNEITSTRQVRNHWYYGWGIRVWFWPRMRIYNVSGLEAVEIVMKNGRIYRLGTDTPTELEAAIKQAQQAFK